MRGFRYGAIIERIRPYQLRDGTELDYIGRPQVEYGKFSVRLRQ